MRVLVTGSAGFIGFHLSKKLLKMGHVVFGYDGMTPYYEVELKRERNRILLESGSFTLEEAMLEDADRLRRTVQDFQADAVVHLAAQAGVRYSIDHPASYIQSNIVGTFNLLEALRSHPVKHLLLASTSSVYGANESSPFKETDRTDFPLSLYAATKRSCESMSHAYAHLFNQPTTCFRFFTVYGPLGRPDMALFKFAKAMSNDLPIEVYGHGQMRRDFTFVDDLIDAIIPLIDVVPSASPGAAHEDSISPVAPWRVVNIGGGHPVELMDFIRMLEEQLKVTAKKVMLPMQQGDVLETWADPTLLRRLIGLSPETPLPEGVKKFLDWYSEYYAPKHAL